VKNTSFTVITYDPSFNDFLMLTIDLFLTNVRLPLGLPPSSSEFLFRRGQGVGDPSGRRSARIWLPGGVQVASGRFGRYRSRERPFWANLERHRSSETAPSLSKGSSVAMQQRPRTERAGHLFSADRRVDLASAKARAVRRRKAGACNCKRHRRRDPGGPSRSSRKLIGGGRRGALATRSSDRPQGQ
jgi:hypothetical protein